jgi:hypothetical protein
MFNGFCWVGHDECGNFVTGGPINFGRLRFELDLAMERVLQNSVHVLRHDERRLF